MKKMLRRYFGKHQHVGTLPPPPPVLSALTLSASTLNENSAPGTFIGTILGTTGGSTISLVDSDGNRVAISSGSLVAGATNSNYETDTNPRSITIRETLAGATNTPRDTVLAYTVTNLNDTNPNAFSFTDVSNVPLSTTETSNTITIAGLGASDSCTATLTGDASSQMQKNGGSWVSGPLTVVNGDTLAVRHTSSGSISTAVNTTLTVGTTSDTFTSTTGSDTPTLAIFSALGAAPLVLSWSYPSFIAGFYGQLQIATDSGFSLISQNIIFFIDGASWALNDESIGLVTPSGTYYARIRVCHDNDSGATTVTGFDPLGNAVSFNADVSAWSNTVTDTINVASTTWNTTTGVNKNTNVTVSGTPALVATGPSGGGFNGAPCGVRATASKTGKKHFEVTLTSKVSNNPNYIGIEDGTTALGPSVFPNPPSSFTGYRTDGVTYKNGSVLAGATTAVAGDVVSIEFDTAGGTLSVFLNGTIQGSQMTGVTTSPVYAYNSLEDNNVFTANFGQNAFSMTPSSGYTMYG